MDILTQDQSRAIVDLAVGKLGFLQDNELWGPAFLGTFIEDGDHYKRGKEGYASPTRYFAYADSIQKATLVLVRPDSQSPVHRAVFVRTEDSPLTEEQISEANAALKELFS